MLHTPIPDRLLDTDEERLPPATGILIAMASSTALWTVIYLGYVLAF